MEPLQQQKPTRVVMVGLCDFLDEEEIDQITRIVRGLQEKYMVREHQFNFSEGIPDLKNPPEKQGVSYIIMKGRDGRYHSFTPEQAEREYGMICRYVPTSSSQDKDILLC